LLHRFARSPGKGVANVLESSIDAVRSVKIVPAAVAAAATAILGLKAENMTYSLIVLFCCCLLSVGHVLEKK